MSNAEIEATVADLSQRLQALEEANDRLARRVDKIEKERRDEEDELRGIQF